MAKNIDIAGRLHSRATGNVVAGADEILDDSKQKKQSQINAEVDATLAGLQTQVDNAGKVDDVEVNGESALDKQTKKVSLTIPTSASAEALDNVPGTPTATAEMVGTDIHFTFHNIKGEKGDPLTWNDLTDQQKASLKGDPGDSAVYNPDDPDVPDFVMAQVLGNSTTKSMTQKSVTEAVMGISVKEWSAITPDSLLNYQISNDGVVSTKDKGRIFYTSVEEGDFIKLVGTRNASVTNTAVVAMFSEAPALDAQATTVISSGDESSKNTEYEIDIISPSSGILAIYFYGASASVTFEKAVTYNEETDRLSQSAYNKATEVANIIGNVEDGITPGTVPGKMINTNGEKRDLNSFSITVPIEVKKGDVVKYTADGGGGGTNSIMNLTDAAGSIYTPLGPDTEGLKERTYEVKADGYICISFKTSEGLTISITHGGLQAKVENLEKNVAAYNNDGTISLLENPLEHLISSPSRVRTFASYGIIGASYETGYTNASGGQVFYDDGYEWPTLMGKVNGVEIYNYALPGHTFRDWLRDRNNTEFNLSDTPFFGNHCMPWNIDTHTPECFIVNLSSNDVSKSSGYAVGDYHEIDPGNIDYTDFEEHPINDMNFCEAATAILQLIREKCPRCYIFVATVRKGVSNTSRAETLNDALKAIAAMFDKCYVLDVYEYGMDWSQQGPGKYVSSDDSSHPTRLGHIYLADQFNTYVDWYIGKHPEQFLDAAYVNPHKVRVKVDGVWQDQDVTFNRDA